MAKQKTQPEDLPTLEDFTESSLLDVVSDDDDDASDEDLDNQDDDEEEEDNDDVDNPLEKKIPEKKSEKKKKSKSKDDDSDDDEDDPESDEEDDEDDEEDEDKKTGDDDDEDDDEDEPEGTFWTDVEKITGVEVEVDYGDTDPESPEGAALREAALVEQVEANMWKYLETNFPKSYKAFTVEANGGDLSELITPNYVDYSKIEVDKENESQQKKILMDYYMDVKKLSEKKAQRMVEADEDSEDEDGLYNAAKEALEERKEAQIKRENEIAEKNRKEAEARQQQDSQMLGYIKAVTDKGEIGNFTLPKADREKFFEFFAKHVNRAPEGQGYIFASPITNESFQSLMEQAYFSFKDGKLDKLVQRRDETKKTRKLKRRADNEKKKGSSTSEENKPNKKKKLPTMDDFQE